MNPLLSLQIDNEHPIPFPFADELYAPALHAHIHTAKENLAKLRSAPATFAGIVEGIEFYQEDLSKVSAIFFNQLSAHTNDTLQALAKEISPKLAELANDLLLDSEIFARVKEVYDGRNSLSLNQEQQKLLEKTYKAFRRNGALLNDEQKAQLREIDKKLSRLTHEFSDHVLKATNDFFLFVEDQEAIKDLPATSLEEAKHLAQEKGKPEAWAFSLQFPSYLPFLQYCTDEKLRKELWFAQSSKGLKAPYDNKDILKEIAHLRHQRANLLGYETHAHFVLEERMAENPQKVFHFLDEILAASKQASEKELEELKQAKKTHIGDVPFMPWDSAFYSERLKKEKFQLSDEDLRPYFRLENVIAGVFEHANRLYGLQFQERKDIPVYHPDVRAYEVKDDKGFVGYFYADFFPRPSKRGGAWMTNYLEQGTWSGKKLRPHVAIVCNFTKPTATEPSLLRLSEVETLFHEFGHALHSLLTDCTYVSLSGTNVYWDFVELPSQIMENWVHESKALALYAKHYKTGEIIPDALVEKIRKSATFQAGLMSVRQLSFAYLDMAWHAQDAGNPADIEAFEAKCLEKTRLLPHIPGTATSTAFSHIFAGGYSAGYYSYKWAEVLDADAFEFFKEKGIFNREVADRFRENVLSKGGTEHPMVLYKRFRGHEPDSKALLRRSGLLPAANRA